VENKGRKATINVVSQSRPETGELKNGYNRSLRKRGEGRLDLHRMIVKAMTATVRTSEGKSGWRYVQRH